MPISKLHAAARAYAEAGWPVFPIRPGEKISAVYWQDCRASDLDWIDKWWGKADYNIGFVPEDIGIGVVDEDTEKGGRYEAGPATVQTPHGRHFYYQGSLPSSASKIAPHVDTRGRNSYVLLPPSCVDGRTYKWERSQPSGAWNLDPIPGWVVKICNRSKVKPRKSPEPIEDGKLDRPQAIKLFKQYLELNPIPPEGEGSDDAVYRVVCRGRDLGLSDGTIASCISDVTSFDPDWIDWKLANAETYQQNEPGCDIPTVAADWAKLAAQAPKIELGPWTPYDPRDPSTLPEVEFFDDSKMLPHLPEGAIGILYGHRGDHKTNTLLSLLDQTRAQRILYAAGEGAYGVERDRIPSRPGLSGRVKLLPRVPRFTNAEEVEAFIAGCNSISFKPEVVIIDTLATALAGEDENTSITASMLSDNGAAGAIKRAWNCTVICVAHSGKDPTRGVRGSSGFEANVDFVILCEADKQARAIRLTCTKMRDGYDGQSSYWTYETDGVPVPTPISETTYRKLTLPAPKEENKEVGWLVKAMLKKNGATEWANGWSTIELASVMAENEMGGPKPDARASNEAISDWVTCYKEWAKRLNALKNKAWARPCWKERADSEEKMVLRWFCSAEAELPPEDQTKL